MWHLNLIGENPKVCDALLTRFEVNKKGLRWSKRFRVGERHCSKCSHLAEVAIRLSGCIEVLKEMNLGCPTAQRELPAVWSSEKGPPFGAMLILVASCF